MSDDINWPKPGSDWGTVVAVSIPGCPPLTLCPSCRQFKQGDGLLCTVCKREADVLRQQMNEDAKR